MKVARGFGLAVLMAASLGMCSCDGATAPSTFCPTSPYTWDVSGLENGATYRVRVDAYKAGIDRYICEGDVVIDLGTGSGILAILLKKLGAGTVLATETDEDALETAERNAIKNGVNFETLVVTESHRYDANCYDVVVANILAPVLIAMAENLSTSLKAKGHLILSGILLHQAPSVIAAFEACGLNFLRQTAMDDWCALEFQCP